ncbi:cytochrome c biogenesis protein CcsA [Paenibacillus ginsengarvi]|uniref:C-type cytochrome biogenesis protein CcsB n=1 Tax=Paenibacillus ginsengarvi TaxID=400777 RepID=A0A3B0CH44_9BACL|nr:cytochrome c biogenesis protein CcsA [Paenibacillus ginsengarvi]RKN84622.1 c-type cytochrome biogenesis protein CcsB [Paenibacillus ginsengarvi]
MTTESLSGTFLLIAFILYTLSFIIFGIAVTGKKWSERDPEKHVKRWGRLGLVLTVFGLLFQFGYFITRWIAAGHIPVSNMFEFLTFLSMMIALAFIIVYAIYRTAVLGLFAMPVCILILAYALVFPPDIQPLIPALQSYWLKIHVTMAAFSEAFYAVGFAAGLMYLLRVVNFKGTSKADIKERRGVEVVIFVVITTLAFVITVFIFKGIGYEAQFKQEITKISQTGQETVETSIVDYVLPPIVQPFSSTVVSMQPFLGMDEPLMTAPSWMNGINAGRKLNTFIWSLIAGAILYVLIRLALRKQIGAAIQPAMSGMDAEDLDEISYRAIAIGFPLFTLGALIFAMIWAHEAWGRFWGWDPKETWALITWLYYTAYLHFRLSRGWQGRKSAWMAVIGFVVVMFTNVGVNLIIAGLHSYAGV